MVPRFPCHPSRTLLGWVREPMVKNKGKKELRKTSQIQRLVFTHKDMGKHTSSPPNPCACTHTYIVSLLSVSWLSFPSTKQFMTQEIYDSWSFPWLEVHLGSHFSLCIFRVICLLSLHFALFLLLYISQYIMSLSLLSTTDCHTFHERLFSSTLQNCYSFVKCMTCQCDISAYTASVS